jgi:hypothetical protein
MVQQNPARAEALVARSSRHGGHGGLRRVPAFFVTTPCSSLSQYREKPARSASWASSTVVRKASMAVEPASTGDVSTIDIFIGLLRYCAAAPISRKRVIA